jgi:hypothetical protein
MPTPTPSGAIRAQGTTLQHGVAAVFTDLEEASDIKLGGVSVSSIDVTHLKSSSKEFIAGLKDNGTCDVSCNFTNGPVQSAMRDDMNNGVTSPYQIVMPTPTSTITIAFSGFLTKYAGPDAKVDGKLEIQMTIKITGDITITAEEAP